MMKSFLGIMPLLKCGKIILKNLECQAVIQCSNDNFRDTIEHEINMILTKCIETPAAMEGLFVFETVKEVCTNLKPGVSGGYDQVTYGHLKYGGPKWSILSILYFRVFHLTEVRSL